MKIGIPNETHAGEMRVATTPAVATELIKLGFAVAIESGAGADASFDDGAYRAAGATIVDDPRTLWSASDIILKVRAPAHHKALGLDEVDLLHSGQILISFLAPAQNSDLLQRLALKGVTTLSMNSVPRISRAQKMDALSSMANIAGYRAVIEAAQHFGRFFTGQITAAGRVPPAKVLVIGAGVAGLSAIGTARSLGAIVRAFDTRPEVKEQVESMNGEFLMLDFKEEGEGAGGYAKTMSPEFIAAEMALFAKQAAEVDIIITTALIPGKPAPKLITADMVATMKPGSVIVDMAAEQGGNCELTEPGGVVKRNGVTIIGYTDLPSRLAAQSSQLYATNLRHLLADMCKGKDGVAVVDMGDEIIRGATVVDRHNVTWPPPPPKLKAVPSPAAASAAHTKADAAASITPTAVSTAKKTPAVASAANEAVAKKRKFAGPAVAFTLGAAVFGLIGITAPPEFMSHFTIFVLACFVGYMVVWNVTPALHTPLMSVTNAISSIIIIGALLQISSTDNRVLWISAAVLTLTSINIAGGFAVTRRMLNMFRK
ncbi:MAG: Re/Si-specific NAD(P)(+) transhydrogenase subunit alpha [Longimicrobiales bacterium]